MYRDRVHVSNEHGEEKNVDAEQGWNDGEYRKHASITHTIPEEDVMDAIFSNNELSERLDKIAPE